MAGASVREACHQASCLISVVLITGRTLPGISYRVLTYLLTWIQHAYVRTYRCTNMVWAAISDVGATEWSIRLCCTTLAFGGTRYPCIPLQVLMCIICRLIRRLSSHI